MSDRFSVRVALALAVSAIALPPATHARAPRTWGQIITDRDRTRLRDWRMNWVAAIAHARAAGANARIAGEGALLQPDSAQAGAPIPDGDYRCRLVKVGARGPGIPEFLVRSGLHCHVEDGALAVDGGPQRPNGRLYRLDDARQLFLGALTLGDEENIMPYRRDPDRDVLGIVERIGPHRWRLAMPQPRWQSMLDVLELIPDPVGSTYAR